MTVLSHATSNNTGSVSLTPGFPIISQFTLITLSEGVLRTALNPTEFIGAQPFSQSTSKAKAFQDDLW